MKNAVWIGVLLCVGIAGCSDKKGRQTVIGGADSVTEIVVADGSGVSDRDTVTYRLPQCCLWYVEKLPEACREKGLVMWTERPAYWENVRVINVFVANPSDEPLAFGRGWSLDRWSGGRWVVPELVADHSWMDDSWEINEAPLLYCFRFPVGEYYRLSEGKYRISKSFRCGGRNVELEAEFEIK